MQQKKTNSFRCFAIFKIGIENQNGQFLTIHKRGCLKTFKREKDDLINAVDQHFDNQSKQQSSENKDQFEFKNWIGIKEQKKNNTYYLLLLCHQNAKKNEALKQLLTLKTWIQKNENYQNIDPIELEDYIVRLEQKYGQLDGYATDEDEDEIQRNKKQQQQQLLEQQQQQQKQQYQQQQQQQQQQQKQQQQQLSQQQQKQKEEQQYQFQTPKKVPEQRQTSAQKSNSATNKVNNANYQQINIIIDKSKEFKFPIKPTVKIQEMEEQKKHNPSDQQKDEKNPPKDQVQTINLKQKKREKQQYRNSEALQQMNESNQLKQADSLIRNSIVGALASGALALIL